MSPRSQLGIVVALVAVIAGCATTAVPRVDAAMATTARAQLGDLDESSLRSGYDGYRARCAGCHQLVPPGRRQVSEWPGLVQEHRSRLELSDAEVVAITAYLQAGRLVAEGGGGR